MRKKRIQGENKIKFEFNSESDVGPKQHGSRTDTN